MFNKFFGITFFFITLYISPTRAQEFFGVSSPATYYIGNVPLSKMSVPSFVKKYVEDSLTIWQKKSKIEKSDAYRNRIENQRLFKTEQLTADALNFIKADKIKNTVWKFTSTENYDADNENYLMSIGSEYINIILKVPPDDINAFDKAFSAGKIEIINPDLAYNGKWLLKSFTVVNQINNKRYSYNALNAGIYNDNQFNLAIEDVNIVINREDIGGGTVIKNKGEIIGTADVDLDIPINTQTNDKTFVVIIANENYLKEVKVQYAANDGKIFKQYCEKTLGIPVKNLHFVQDATFGIMKSEIKWISDVASAYNGQAKIIFYYAGHGMPNEVDKSAYLLPVDGFSSDFETAIKLDDLYSKLSSNPSQSVTVFLDACFSGSIRDDAMLANARGVKIKPNPNVLKGNMLVFSAASGEETAYPYKEKQHGLFTYFLLKKLQETKGDVNYETLLNYIRDNVRQQSVLVNQKSQTPQINIAFDIQDTWRAMKMK
jgi:hypothetical protein